MSPPRTLPNRRALVLLSCAVVVLGAATLHRLVFAPLPGPLLEFSGPTMGTTFLVKVAVPEMSRGEYERVAGAIVAELDAVDRLMSTWNPDSELSRFNRQPAGEPFRASPQTIDVFGAAREVSVRSRGAFDVTVAPLVAAWGFGVGARAPGGPDAAELAALRARVGFEKIEIDAQAGTLTKLAPDVSADLSAIAKGHAVDRVADTLVALGYPDHLVEVGGELRAGGVRPDGGPWRVAVETPAPSADAARSVQEVVAISDRGMATSGDYRNYYEEDGVRISHTIDPRTGRPIRHALASVTVLDANAMQADAWATALDVLGPDDGLALAQDLGLAAYFILRDERGGFQIRETAPFAAARALAADSE